ncbi:hypothetical protein RQM47_16080 [Rubrivirga sp. S365]|nr:hypothetical protein [Rubrivirga sp. S365]MDT7858167.1 hypothetical protein [Rubrivirga sp. S365]
MTRPALLRVTALVAVSAAALAGCGTAEPADPDLPTELSFLLKALL